MNMNRLITLFALAIIMSACVKPNEPKEIRFSILGDSFSAFQGYVEPATNDVWYCPPPNNYVDVTSVEQMWWHKVATKTGWVLDVNNSFSGSLVSNFWGFNTGLYFSPHSFIRRMDNLGNPDVILVFGATNDIYKRAALGDYVFDNWTEEELCMFRPAMAYMFDYLKRNYPTAEVYFMLDMELCISDTSIDDATRQAYIESVHYITSHYNVSCIDIYGIQKDLWHPNVAGHATIASQLIDAIEVDFNV